MVPGSDGLSGSYYKCFEDELLQPLWNIMNILQGGTMPDDNIALLFNEG